MWTPWTAREGVIAPVNRDERGLFKLVADIRTDDILGVHMLTEGMGDVIHAGVLAVKFHLSVHDRTDPRIHGFPPRLPSSIVITAR